MIYRLHVYVYLVLLLTSCELNPFNQLLLNLLVASLHCWQIGVLRHGVSYILLEQSVSNEDLFVAVVNLLTSAARHQVCYLRFQVLYVNV